MQKLITLLIAACALALTLVAIAPYQASASWRRGWGYYGVDIYVRPGYGYRRYYAYAYYPYWRGTYWWQPPYWRSHYWWPGRYY
jgi:hypothetical protein